MKNVRLHLAVLTLPGTAQQLLSWGEAASSSAAVTRLSTATAAIRKYTTLFSAKLTEPLIFRNYSSKSLDFLSNNLKIT